MPFVYFFGVILSSVLLIFIIDLQLFLRDRT